MSQDLQVQSSKPSWLIEFEGECSDEVDLSVLKQEFIKVGQVQTKEVQDGLIQVGDFINSVTQKVYQKPLIATILKIVEFWRRFDNKTMKLERYSEDGISWDDGSKLTDEEKWKCNGFDCFVIPEGEKIPGILSFSGASFKSGKDIKAVTTRFIVENEPIFLRKYIFTTEIRTTPKKHAVINFNIANGFNSMEDCKMYSELRKLLVSSLKNRSALNHHLDAPSSDFQQAEVIIDSNAPLDID